MKKFLTVFICAILAVNSSLLTVFASDSEDETYSSRNYGYLPYERPKNSLFAAESNSESCINLMGNSSDTELLSEYDSRTFGYVSPVKDQGSGNTCWAFAAIGALESYMLKFYGEKDGSGIVINTNEYDFSENHMQYILSKWNNNPLGYETGTGAKSGGNTLMSSNYFMNDYGPVWDSDDSYVNINTRDYSATKDIPKSDYKVDSVAFVEQYYEVGISDKKRSLINQTKQLVKDYGSAVCGISAKFFSVDKKNLYCGKESSQTHQVLIVGWDDSYPKENFVCANNEGALPEYDGAFIIKNSWGASSGDNGFFYLSYCDYNLFSDVMAITSVSRRNNGELLYNYDIYGRIGGTSYGIAAANPVSYGNAFKRKTSSECLKGVRLYANPGVTYDIYLVNAPLEDDTQEGFVKFNNYDAVRQKVYSGFTAPDGDGYYTVYFNKNYPVSDEFAIVVTADSDNVIYIPFESNCNIVSKAEINPKESFYIHVGYYSGVFSESYGDVPGNFCVKAITETEEPYAEFEFANFTDLNGTEKTDFKAGDTVYVVPAMNGVNLSDKEILCVGYKNNKVQTVIYKNISDKNRFEIENIPADFDQYSFYMYSWEMSELKPLCGGIKVGTK